jgi:hypothetical protein
MRDLPWKLWLFTTLGLMAAFFGFFAPSVLSAGADELRSSVAGLATLCSLTAVGLFIPQALLNRWLLGSCSEALSTRALAPAFIQLPINLAYRLVDKHVDLFLLSMPLLFVVYQLWFWKGVFPHMDETPRKVPWFLASGAVFVAMIPLAMLSFSLSLRLVMTFMTSFGLSFK